MPFGAEVVPDEWSTMARSSAWRSARSSGRSCPANASTSLGRIARTIGTGRRHLAALGDLLSPPKLTIAAGARLLHERRQLALVEHGRQRGQDDPAVQAPEHGDGGLDRVAAQQHDDFAGVHAARREAVRDADRGAMELLVGHPAVVEDERDACPGPRRARAANSFHRSPVPPVALRVIALGLRLEGQRGLAQPRHSYTR